MTISVQAKKMKRSSNAEQEDSKRPKLDTSAPSGATSTSTTTTVARQSFMEALPEDVLVDVMQYMDIRDMASLEAVTSAGRERIQCCYKIAGLESVTIGRNDSVQAIAAWLTDRELHPSALIIVGQTLSEMREWDELRTREKFAPMQSVTSVVLANNDNMDDACLVSICTIFPNLQSLSVKRGPKITSVGFGALSALGFLRSLSLEACDVSDDKATAIAMSVPGLQHLSMPGAGRIMTRLDMLESLTLLETLMLWNNTLPDDAIESLTRLPALRSVNLGWCSLSDAALPHLAACPSLTEVVLYDNPKITPLGLWQLPATIFVSTDLNDESGLGGYDDEAVEQKIMGEKADSLFFDLSLLRRGWCERCSRSCRQRERSCMESPTELCDVCEVTVCHHCDMRRYGQSCDDCGECFCRRHTCEECPACDARVCEKCAADPSRIEDGSCKHPRLGQPATPPSGEQMVQNMEAALRLVEMGFTRSELLGLFGIEDEDET
jgi:hypothetical protein